MSKFASAVRQTAEVSHMALHEPELSMLGFAALRMQNIILINDSF